MPREVLAACSAAEDHVRERFGLSHAVPPSGAPWVKPEVMVGRLLCALRRSAATSGSAVRDDPPALPPRRSAGTCAPGHVDSGSARALRRSTPAERRPVAPPISPSTTRLIPAASPGTYSVDMRMAETAA